MVNQELSSLLKMQEIINQKLEQLNFETKQDVYRISQHDRAGVPKVPSNNKRLKYMAAAPVGVLFLIFGWFLIGRSRPGLSPIRRSCPGGSVRPAIFDSPWNNEDRARNRNSDSGCLVQPGPRRGREAARWVSARHVCVANGAVGCSAIPLSTCWGNYYNLFGWDGFRSRSRRAYVS